MIALRTYQRVFLLLYVQYRTINSYSVTTGCRVHFPVLQQQYFSSQGCIVVFVTTELESLYYFSSRMKNQRGHWVCCMSTGRKNGLM